MKCTIPEISWHNREPVLSVDIFPENRDFYRLASGGGDCHVLIWQMNITENGAVNQEVISDLTRHQRAVNCVRWSNTGQYLASGDDDANIIVWQLKTDNIPLLEGDTGDKEIWTIFKVMRGHKEDVYDLCWSMDRTKLFSGSVDNTAILWDVNKGKMDRILTDHKGFVQGVSWDPKNQIIATISTDRICRIFDPIGKQVKARIYKGKLSVPDGHYLQDKEVKFFHDDTFKSFFRRLQFTPDGSLLIVPSGHIEADGCKNVINATLLFTLDNFSSPAVILPLPHQSSTVVRCCPILFELHEDGPDPVINLPYRMIFAVGTDRDIILYDTQQAVPFARFQDIHYTRLTDLTWSQDGLLLIASSTDGFCSLITFEMDELGVPWTKTDSEAEENPLDISGCEELVAKDENVDTNNKEISVEEKLGKIKEDAKEESKKRPSFLEQWAIQKPKKKKLDAEANRVVNGKEGVSIEILDSPERKDTAEDSSGKMDAESTEQKKKDVPINRLIPRRITPVQVNEGTKGIMNTQNEASCSTQKPSEPRGSKVVDLERDRQESEDEEDSSDSAAENLSKEELQELHKASENIREFFCRIPKKQETHSDIKPIAVRRQPREIQTSGHFQKTDGTVFTTSKHSDAKPIAIRRKPREPGTIQRNEAGSEEKSVISLAKDHSDAKPIAVKRKPKDETSRSKKSEEGIKEEKKAVEHNDKEKSSKNKRIVLSATDIKSSEDIVCIVDSDDDEYNTTPKKLKSDQPKPSPKVLEERPPKIKVSSLVKRKDSAEKTPKKSNALLNFLQKSAEKKTKKQKKDKVETIDLSLEENEARDAWKCDSRQGVELKNNRTMPVDDDKTEDFCLQLEDSQEGCDEEEAEPLTSGKCRKSNEPKEGSASAKEKGSSSKSTVPKTPRRVPLITLASPKGKTKRE